MATSTPLTLSVQLPGDLRLALSTLRVQDVNYNNGPEIKLTLEIDFALQQEAKRRNNGTFRGELIGQFELPPLLPSKPAPNSLISTVAETTTTPCDRCSETSSTPLLALPGDRRRGRSETRSPSAGNPRRSTTRPLEPRSEIAGAGVRQGVATLTRNSFGHPLGGGGGGGGGTNSMVPLTEKYIISGSLTGNNRAPLGPQPASRMSTPPRRSLEGKKEGSAYNGPTVLGRGDSTILSSSALTEPIGRSETLDPLLITYTIQCLNECSQDVVSRSSSSNMGGRRADIISPSGAFEQMRSLLRSVSPSDVTLAAFDSTRVKGAPWLIQLHVLHLLQRMAHHHSRSLEKHDRMLTLFILLSKCTDNLRSTVVRQTLALINDVYNYMTVQRVLDSGVGHLLPACLRRAADTTNLFLSEAAVEAVTPIIAKASEAPCFSCIKSLISSAKTGAMRKHLFRVARRLAEKSGAKLTALPEVERIVTFAIKGLRDADSESRSEARLLCSTLTECLTKAPSKEVGRIQNKVRPEDWQKFLSLRSG